MILATAAALSVLGVVLFVIGEWTGNAGVSMVGAIIVIGVGAAGMTTGIEVASGQNVTAVTENNTTTKTIETVYTDIDTATDFPVGVIVLAAGSIMLLGATGRASEKDLKTNDERP
jgi:hypothetical protein